MFHGSSGLIGVVLSLLAGILLLTAAYKLRNSRTVSGLAGVNEFDDFINNVTGTPYSSFKANGGSIDQVPLAARSTLIRLHSNGAGDIAGISAVDPNGSGCIVVEPGTSTSIAADCSINASAVNPPTSTFIFGFGENQNPKSNPGRDSYLMFDRSVSNNWIAVRKDGTNTIQTVTTLPVVFNDVGGSIFTQLKVIMTVNQSLYYVNGSLVASVTQDWSGLTNPTVGPVVVLSTASGTSDIENVFVDYMWLIHNFATVRPTP